MQITLYDAAGAVLTVANAVSNARRYSVRLAAWQRQLDSMFEPRATRATIGTVEFIFDHHGRSQFIGYANAPEDGSPARLPAVALTRPETRR